MLAAMRRRRAPLRWPLAIAALGLLSVAVVLATRWSPVVAAHPAYPITLTLVAVACAAVALGAVFTRTAGDGAPARRSRWRLAAGIVASILAVALFGVLIWLRPLGATGRAIDALANGRGVDVSQSATRIALRPTGRASGTGLVFYPGAKVDARAYAAILRPLAEAGHPVVIVKLPFGIAFADADAAGDVIGDEDRVARWVVAGHSLGGTVAARYAGGGHRGVAGLLLWASYPASSIRDRAGLAVTSVSATEDGLATPADIAASRADLPPGTRFVAVEGAVHADFGDYGSQSGDGTRTITHEEAQRRIVAASLAMLERIGG